MLENNIQLIELELQAQIAGQWVRLSSSDISDLNKRLLIRANAGWKIDLANGFVICPNVNYLLLVIDTEFPLSQPRILAPEAFHDFSWPHVETGGVLCLKNTNTNGDVGHRVLKHIEWAIELLSLDEISQRREFELEFSSYWNHKKSKFLNFCTSVLSLLTPVAKSREIVWYHDTLNMRIIVADTTMFLTEWLRNAGLNPSVKEIHSSWLEWLPRPWIPSEFPENGRSVLDYIPIEFTDAKLRPGKLLPIIFGAETMTGVVFVATLLQGISEEKLVRGFRNISKVPKKTIRNSFLGQTVLRYPVIRVDGAWIHGRDHNTIYPFISNQKVAIIGCGALGASIARLLAESGISDFVFVDHDLLTPPNVSRHVLGLEYIGMNKAAATALMLKRSFPHLKDAQVFKGKFEHLTNVHLNKLVDCNVILSCGISYEGDIKIDDWRKSQKIPPAHVCCWTEEFAIVGHAIGLLGRDSLLDAFDIDQKIKFRLTDWPAESGALIVEAGCGNVFQPHGAVDLQATISLSAGLALDVISNKLLQSTRRVWHGNKDEVTKRGGNVLAMFTDNLCIREFPWL